jgi:NitT/TauT family transport system substrate-binding protein
MILFDTIGFASFTVVGAQVALMAGLGWYWIPFCAGLTCAGGGMLLDIVTGREPRTFQGELYEEIAVAGGLLLYVLLLLANRYEHTPWVVTGAIVTTLVVVFTTRILVVRYGIRSYRLGTPEPSSTS